MFIIILFKLLSYCLFVSAAVQKWDNKFLGCYLEENVLSLGDERRVLTPASPQACSEFCSSDKEYKFFILKNNICYCSKNYMSSLMKQADSDCTIKCTGDTSASCGGTPNFVSSYITDSSKSIDSLGHDGYPIPIYLGCYSETPNDNKNRLLKGPVTSYDNNTPQKCSEICFNMGYLYVGVTNRSECRCGNQKPLKFSKTDEKNCNSHCSGNNKQFCGGHWKMGIYSTGITDYIPRRYVGCFKTDETKLDGKHFTYKMGNNNSPKRCMNLCNTRRYKYAAVMGNMCECKNYEPDFSLKKSYSDCNSICDENPSEYCGSSENALQNVYKTLHINYLKLVSTYHIGCFQNPKKHPLLNGWELTIPQLTPQKCVNSCFARRFLYAALISSNECLCSFMKPHDDAITDDNMCKTRCPGSSEATCGGDNTINVYSTALNWKTEAFGNYYKGCVQNNRNSRVYEGYFRNFPMNTPEFCSSHCYKLGYTYSGVTNRDECFCDNQEPDYTRNPKLNDDQCNTKCSGDANQFCGGVRSMSVFSTGLEHFGFDEGLLECYKPQTNTLRDMDMSFSLTESNRPSLCFKLCSDYTYTFAGVMGTSCLCSNNAPDNSHKRNNAECNKNCISPSFDLCVVEDRIHMYKLKIHQNYNQLSNTYDPTTFQEELDSLNLRTLWTRDIYIPQEPDYEFVFYNNSKENAFMTNGEIVIRPTILSDDRFVKDGSLILKGCTSYEDFNIYCSKNASSFNIIPPIMSAKLITKNSFFFRLGKLEIVAKLPIGDWIVSEIALISKYNEKNKFILATSFENTDKLQCNLQSYNQYYKNNESAIVLKYGLKIDEQYHLESIMMQSNFSNRWSDDYHSFVLSWTEEDVEFKIDGESTYVDAVWNLPLNIILDSEFYISVSVSVGGISNFRDNSMNNNGHCKPWSNTDPKAMLNFWKHRNEWEPTWDEEKSMLRIRSVKFSTKQNINKFGPG